MAQGHLDSLQWVVSFILTTYTFPICSLLRKVVNIKFVHCGLYTGRDPGYHVCIIMNTDWLDPLVQNGSGSARQDIEYSAFNLQSFHEICLDLSKEAWLPGH